MNNESVVFGGLSGLLRTNVLTPICSYLQTRQQQGPLTVEELANVLKLPSSAPLPSSTPGSSFAPMPSGFPAAAGFAGMTGAPPMLTGFAGMPMPLGAQKKTRGKTTNTQPAADHERCVYQITRGANKGNRCINKIEGGLQYCTQHKGTRAAQNHMQGGAPAQGQMQGQMQGGMSGMPGLPGMPMMPGMQSMPMMPVAQPQQPKIQVHQVAPGLYREASQGLAIKTGSTPNEYIACGVLVDPKTTQITPLTPDKIDYCRQIGLAYVDPSKPGESVVKPAPVNNYAPPVNGSFAPPGNNFAPQASGSFAAPSSNVSGQTFPTMAQQLPALPTGFPGMGLPQAGMQMMPQVQPLGGIGGLPGGFPGGGFPGSSFPGGAAVTDMRGTDDPNDDDVDDDEGDE